MFLVIFVIKNLLELIHLSDCEKKYREKQGNKVVNAKPTFSMGPINSRQPTMPAVQYGAFANRPNLKFKF